MAAAPLLFLVALFAARATASLPECGGAMGTHQQCVCPDPAQHRARHGGSAPGGDWLLAEAAAREDHGADDGAIGDNDLCRCPCGPQCVQQCEQVICDLVDVVGTLTCPPQYGLLHVTTLTPGVVEAKCGVPGSCTVHRNTGSCAIECQRVCGEHQHVSGGSCACDRGWSGVNCTVACSGHGHAHADGSCTCTPPYTGDVCQHVCNDRGHVGPDGACVCTGPYTGPLCLQCAAHAHETGGGDTCTCDFGWAGDDCSVPCPRSFDGQVCSGHGTCVHETVAGRAHCDCDAWYGPPGTCEAHCIGGYVAPEGDAAECICDADYYASDVLHQCTRCPPRSTSPSNSTSPAACVCVEDTYRDEDADECVPCPGGSTTTGPGAVGPAACVCSDTTYRNETTGACTPCPAHMTVGEARNATSEAACVCAPGYWGAHDTTRVCTACVPHGACAGRTTCARGYESDACARCAAGFYRDLQRFSCERCPAEHDEAYALFWLGVLLVVAWMLVVSGSKQWFFVAMPLMMGLTYMQFVVVLRHAAIEWPSSVHWGQRIFGFLNFDVGAYGNDLATPTECASHLSFYSYHVTYLLMPLIVGVALVLVYRATLPIVLRREPPPVSSSHAGGGGGQVYMLQDNEEARELRWSAKFTGAFLQFFALYYIFLLSQLFLWFDCEDADVDSPGKLHIRHHAEIECYSPEWHRYLPFVVVCILVYVVAYPLALVVLTVRHRRDPFKDDVELHDRWRWAFLYLPFHEGAWYWGVMNVVRKVLCVAMMRVMSSGEGQMVVLFLLLFALEIASFLVTPFKLWLHNLSERILQALLLAIVMLGMFFTDDTEWVVWSTVADVLGGLFLAAMIITACVTVTMAYKRFALIHESHAPAKPSGKPAVSASLHESLLPNEEGGGAA